MKNGGRKAKQKIWYMEYLKRSYREWIKECWSYYERWSRWFKVRKIAKVLKRKTAAIKALEEEIVELETNTENKNQVSTRVEIYCKANLNITNKFLGKHTGKGHNDNVTKRVNTVNLPKLEISKFNGDPKKWQSFFDSFQAANGKSINSTGVEKFNYLRCFLEGDGLHAIAGFSLTNDNYKEALELLQSRYGNTQQIVAAHMSALIKISSVDNEDLCGLRKFLWWRFITR